MGFFQRYALFLFIFNRALSEISGVVGGIGDNSDAYVAFIRVDDDRSVMPVSHLPIGGFSTIEAVAVNGYGQVLAAGAESSGAAYAAFIHPTRNKALSPIANLSDHSLLSAAINDLGRSILGGHTRADIAYAAFLDPFENTARNPIAHLPQAPSIIHSVAINNLDRALIGGVDSTNTAYAAFADPLTNRADIPVSDLPGFNGKIFSVAINDQSQAFVGGVDSNGAYAAFVDPSANRAGQALSNLPNSGSSVIYGVAINELGQALIGGADSNGAYAAFVDLPVNAAKDRVSNLPKGSFSTIISVAINEFSQGLIGGFDQNGAAYAALVDPKTNRATPFSLSLNGIDSGIRSVALLQNPRISVQDLEGAHRIFSDYINEQAKEAIFYFFPSIYGMNLEEGIKNASPARNAFAVFAADNNMFLLNQGLASHLRNHRHFERRPAMAMGTTVSWREKNRQSRLLASLFSSGIDFPVKGQGSCLATGEEEKIGAASDIPWTMDKSYTLWFEAVGALSSQKASKETVGFDPKAGGFILGFDKMAWPNVLCGGGVAYTFTHVSEEQDAGHSDLHQEYLFVYGTWDSDFQMYVDGALWAAIFQTHQVRNIHLSPFHFVSQSSPSGFQLSPHIELGYEYLSKRECKRFTEWMADPFAMVDWVNTWQYSYRETGSGPFNVEQASQYSSFLRTEIGIRFYEVFVFGHWRLGLEQKGSYVNQTPFSVGRVNAFFVGSPGSFTIDTLTHTQNLGAVEFSFIFEPTNHCYPYGSISYQGEFGSSYQSHQLIGEVSWDF